MDYPFYKDGVMLVDENGKETLACGLDRLNGETLLLAEGIIEYYKENEKPPSHAEILNMGGGREALKKLWDEDYSLFNWVAEELTGIHTLYEASDERLEKLHEKNREMWKKVKVTRRS